MNYQEKSKTYDEAEKMFLCRPCAEKMKGMKMTESVKIGQHQKAKGTCEQCGCRRYGYICDVVFVDLSKEKATTGGK